MALILASTSPYRLLLLERLGLQFTVQASAVAEIAYPGESPQTLVQRLAAAKVHAIAQKNPSAVVIGADQLASIIILTFTENLTKRFTKVGFISSP